MGQSADTTAARPGRALLRWVVAWAVLGAVSVGLRLFAWRTGEDAPGTPGWRGVADGYLLKPVLNFIETLLFPGWIVGYWLGGDGWRTRSVLFVLLSNALGWLMVLLVLALGLWVWRGSRGSPACSPSASARPRSVPTEADPALQSAGFSRRRLIADGLFGVAALGSTGAAAKATLVNPWRPVVREYAVPISDLPAPLDGMRVVQVSDPHFGPRMPADAVTAAVELALSLRPDVVALTGDYILAGSRYIAGAASLLSPLASGPRAVPCVGVLGNHDWYGDAGGMRRALEDSGVSMIDNGRVFLDAGTRGLSRRPPVSGLCLAGLGDLYCDKIDGRAALEGVDPLMPRIVLAHNPDTAEHPQVVRGGRRVDLMLSGHTHGGQVRLPLLGAPIVPSAYGRKYVGGLVRGPVCPVVVSRGVGTTLLPVRLGVPPEVVLVVLRRA